MNVFRGGAGLTVSSGAFFPFFFLNQRIADEKLGWHSLSTMREKTQEMNSDPWSQFKHFPRSLRTARVFPTGFT